MSDEDVQNAEDGERRTGDGGISLVRDERLFARDAWEGARPLEEGLPKKEMNCESLMAVAGAQKAEGELEIMTKTTPDSPGVGSR